MKSMLGALLSFNAGYVDTAGFLALHGLFTTHVTGNFVTFGAALALGTTGVLAKLLALPLFCLVIFLIRLLGHGLERGGRMPPLRVMLAIQFLLLAGGAALAVRFGPFPDGDALPALLTGGALVSAMAIQNAAHRTYLTDVPPTTVMTLGTTQLMVDLADLAHGLDPEAKAAVRKRLGPISLGVACFAAGCGGAALLYAKLDVWCFCLPPTLAVVVLALESSGRPKAA